MKKILSISSYKKRFDTLHICLESLFKQICKPDLIILYTNEDLESIPHSIYKFVDSGLSIKHVDIDLKPHNKYFYAMQDYPDDIIITVDDDMIYPPDLILKLMESYSIFPNAVSAGRAHKIITDKNDIPLPYHEWQRECDLYNTPSLMLMATGVGGVLYPPKCMDNRVFDYKALLKLCKYSDDIWLKCMQILKGTPVCLIKQSKQHPDIISNTQQCGLYHINKDAGRNDIYLRNMINEYKINFTRERLE